MLFAFVGLASSRTAIALQCPAFPEQITKNVQGEVDATVGRIGPVSGGELKTRAQSATQDLLGRLPEGGRIYLEQMMFASYCSVLKDDRSLSDTEKGQKLLDYSQEVRGVLKANPEQQHSTEKPEKSELLKVLANSVKGVHYQNKIDGYVQVNFEARGKWLAIPEDISDPNIPKAAKGYISASGAPTFLSNDNTPCPRVPLGALIVMGKNHQCKAYGEKGFFELGPGEAVDFLMNDVKSLYNDNKGFVEVQLSISKK